MGKEVEGKAEVQAGKEDVEPPPPPPASTPEGGGGGEGGVVASPVGEEDGEVRSNPGREEEKEEGERDRREEEEEEENAEAEVDDTFGTGLVRAYPLQESLFETRVEVCPCGGGGSCLLSIELSAPSPPLPSPVIAVAEWEILPPRSPPPLLPGVKVNGSREKENPPCGFCIVGKDGRGGGPLAKK